MSRSTTAATSPVVIKDMDQKEIDAVKDLNVTTLEELDMLKKSYMKKVQDQGQLLLKKEFAAFFAANPDVEAVAWRQYTPYFNDGDACTFGVHDFNFRLRGTSTESVTSFSYGEDSPWYTAFYLGYYGDSDKGEETPEQKQRMLALKPAASSFSTRFRGHSDLFEMTFGDHVKVIATPERFFVDEISHD